MKFSLLLLTMLSGLTVYSQEKDLVTKYSAYIDTADLRAHLTELAGDAYEGRETGKAGQRMAAEYIECSFEDDSCYTINRRRNYLQEFKVIESVPGGSLNLFGKDLSFKKDFFYYGAKQLNELTGLEAHIIEDFAKQDFTDAVVIHRLDSLNVREITDDLKKRAKGIKAIVLVATNYDLVYEYLEHYAVSPSMRLFQKNPAPEIPIIIVKAESVGKLKKKYAYLATSGSGKAPKKVSAVGLISARLNESQTELTSSNVAAFIPGSDPALSKELVVLTAHYDHIGIVDGVVYNGADDDGTGTVALLEIAEAFSQAYRDGNGPKRSIMIMTVSGEEKGLLGSQYYVDHPLWALDKTVADLNIDMIGRNDIAHEGQDDYIYIIGSDMISPDLHKANESANKEYTNLELDYRFNSKNDPNQFYYRSDHYNFAKNGIPSIFYFSGIHEDYHQPTDDIEKINFAKVEKVARLVFATAWKLANAKGRPAVTY